MKKVNNKGFTLIETLLCFVILGIIMVIASQIIHSTTETYYLNRSLSYGMQASQIVSTEIKGEIEDALPLCLYEKSTSSYSPYYIKISNAENNKFIEYIDSDGKQVMLSLENDGSPVLDKYLLNADPYNNQNMKRNIESNSPNIMYRLEKKYDSKYIGMGYEVRDISITQFNATDKLTTDWNQNSYGKRELDIGTYPVLVLKIKVCNNQYGEYECVEYIPLYNFYGISSDVFGTNINITS